ncbi:plasmid stabilization protein [Arcobacter sp. FW59]|nr:plasmid stabilization protein [Arcobacter sp. FW59]
MKIIRTKQYNFELQSILEYISEDKVSASRNFYLKLNKQIKELPTFPYKCRKSIYFNDENIRDMIFKGYTILYEVSLEQSKIIIYSVFNQNKPN